MQKGMHPDNPFMECDLLVRRLYGADHRIEKVRARSNLRTQTDRKSDLQEKALNASANAIVITNRAGKIEWANPAFTTLTGYSRGSHW